MAWIKLEDNAADHPKIAGLSDRAFRSWVRGLCYASRFLTDGLLPVAFLVTVQKKFHDELVNSGLWSQDAAGVITVHDYLEHQRDKATVAQQRKSNARRQDLFRNPELREAVRKRDGDNCRYCGHQVFWFDRRGEFGGTYDHIDPRGLNVFENLVVCCRGCNAKKQDRTAEQMGMKLRPIQNGSKSEPWLYQGQSKEEEELEKKEQIQKHARKARETTRFDEWYSAYPKKIGRGAAVKAWEKIHPDDALVAKMLDALKWQRNQPGWVKDGGEFIPNPATYLNQARWEDEPFFTSAAPQERSVPTSLRVIDEMESKRNVS